jgi:hypothetical protein
MAGSRRALSVESSGYVIAWENSSFGGSSVVLSQNYASLVGIGWNDRISSYKVYTSLTGGFYQHINYGGRLQVFCCYQQIGYVGDLYNDTFSSITIP